MKKARVTHCRASPLECHVLFEGPLNGEIIWQNVLLLSQNFESRESVPKAEKVFFKLKQDDKRAFESCWNLRKPANTDRIGGLFKCPIENSFCPVIHSELVNVNWLMPGKIK